MTNQIWLQGLITVMALLCLSMIWHELSKGRLSRREIAILIIPGPFSWAAQLWLLNHIQTGDEQTLNRLILCTFAALGCFIVVILLNLFSFIRSRDVTQAILWGMAVFPLVLVTFLPEGSKTLFALLGI